MIESQVEILNQLSSAKLDLKVTIKENPTKRLGKHK